MSREFKDNLDRMLDGNLSTTEGDKETVQGWPVNAREVMFTLLDGRVATCYYPYLEYCEFCPRESKITLEFSKRTVSLHGVNLQALYVQLARHTIKEVSCTHSRYNVLNDDGAPVINDIIVTER